MNNLKLVRWIALLLGAAAMTVSAQEKKPTETAVFAGG